jgi:hypothetical protein
MVDGLIHNKDSTFGVLRNILHIGICDYHDLGVNINGVWIAEWI